MRTLLPLFIKGPVLRLWKSLIGSPRHRLRRLPANETYLGAVPAEVLEHRALLSSAVVPNVTMTVLGNDITLTSTDINDPTITVTRSGSNVVVTGANGTLITLGSNVAAVESVAISSVNNLTVNLGTGNDTVTITGLSVTGNIAINGQSSGIANITINAGTPSVVIGGSIQANLGSEAVTFGLFGSSNGGGSMTVTGSVSITEAGAGNKQVNIYGPPANNATGGQLIIDGSVGVLDTGNGQSGLRIDDGTTIGGNVSFDNSANTVNADTVQIFSNSTAFGTTSIAGSLTLALGQAQYQTNFVVIQGFGTSLAVTGAVHITSGGAIDNIDLANVWFKSTTQIDMGSSPSFGKDLIDIDGSRFDGATTVSSSGPYAALNLGTNPQAGVTSFNSSFAASLTGASAVFRLSNAAATVNQVVFNSTFTVTGGTPAGTLIAQGRYSVNPGQFTKTNFNMATTVATVVPNVTVAVQGNDITLTSTDINNPTITVTRAGGLVVVTGTNGTLITLGSKFDIAESAPISSVNNLTVNLGTGNDTVTITGLSVTGNITINGQSSGIANITINAGTPNVVIGGSIQANLGSEAATFGVFGSANGGGSLTVNGSINITEAGAGTKQVNIYGPPANNTTGGKLIINGSVGVVDTGNGQSGLRIDDGVTIGGNVSFDNSANTVNADDVQMYSNSNAFGTTSIAGALTISLGQALYQTNTVVIQGFGTSLAVTGALHITSGGAADNVQLLNDWFKSPVQINTGSSPSFSNDVVTLNGSRFDGGTTVSMTGPFPELDLGVNLPASPTVFNGGFSASVTGTSPTIKLSNSVANVTDYLNAGNGLLAHLFEDGAGSLAVLNEVGNLVLGHLITPLHAVVPSWNNDLAIIVQGKITWSDGAVWNQITSAALPVTVIDYTNSANQMTAHVIMNGTSTVVFVNEFGTVVQGTLSGNGAQATVPAWGNLVATISSGQIRWSNGSTWNLTTKAAPQIVVKTYINPANGLTSFVVHNGTNTVVFVNEFGSIMLGSFTDTVHATVAGWGNDVATFGNDQITWSDGSVWNLKEPGSFPITVTAYVNAANNSNTYVIQTGTNTFVFVNEHGSVVLGTTSDGGMTATVADWGGDVATFGTGKITWSDGSTWNTTTNTHPTIAVADYVNLSNGLATHVILTGTNTAVFVNELGNVVLGSLNGSRTQATVAAWGGDVATFRNGKITWSDGSVWLV